MYGKLFRGEVSCRASRDARDVPVGLPRARFFTLSIEPIAVCVGIGNTFFRRLSDRYGSVEKSLSQ